MASITKRPDGRWRARYRDEAGKEHAKHFDRKVDGQRWLDEVTAAVVTGQYVDPKAGRRTFRAYAEAWAASQPHGTALGSRSSQPCGSTSAPFSGNGQSPTCGVARFRHG